MNTKLICYFLLLVTILSQSSNLPDLLVSEFGLSNALAMGVVSTALCIHVVHIILMRSDEKMEGIETASVIAAVKYAQTWRNRAEHSFPHKPMQKVLLFFAAKSDSEVPVMIKPAIPLETIMPPHRQHSLCIFKKTLRQIIAARLLLSCHTLIIPQYYVKAGV